MLNELPPLPRPDIEEPGRFGINISWRAPSMHAYGRTVEAATLATVTPLVQQMASALENLLAEVRGECPALLDEDRGGSAYLGMDADDAVTAARAWLVTPAEAPPGLSSG